MTSERLRAHDGTTSQWASGRHAGGLFLVRCLPFWILILASGCARAPGPAAQPTNVVLISVDTLRADHLGCYGAGAVSTPAIDRLAADGVRFEHAYSPVPLTLPAHWTIHTGLEPWRHGVVDNGIVFPDTTVTTLAERFAGAGYDTGAIVAAFVLNRAFGLDRGFGHYDDGPSADAEIDRLFHGTAPADERVGEAISWLRRPRDRPYFLWLHLYDPHAPYAPPPAFRRLYPERDYDGEIAFVDTQIARLLAALESSEGSDRTLVVLLSDHGESLGEHGELTHGVLLYDATLRVPLIFRLPSRLRAGTVREEAVTLADVAPSILALAGLDPLQNADGRDLFRPRLSFDRTLGAISEYPRRRLGWASLVAVRQGPWKLIFGPRPELFDVARDPGETLSRVETNPGTAAALDREARAIAREVRERAGAEAPTEAGAEEHSRLAALGYLNGPTPAGLAGANPRDAISFLAGLDRASQLLASQQIEEAKAAFLVYTKAANPPLAALEGLGRIARLQGRSVEAERYFSRLLELDSESISALAQLVVLARERGDSATAVERSARLVRLAPRSAGASRLHAEALAAAGQRTAAEAEWRRGLEASPGAGWLRLSWARYLAGEQLSRESAAELERILADEEISEELRAAATAARAALSASPSG